MASKTEQLLIVVSILEGRHFPKSQRHSLVVQAKFDGEQLATDPVEHREKPQFSTELAWELDRRTLHQHRLQRTPIKLQCFAVDCVSQTRESVGYIVLDLRSVQEVRREPSWYPLLSSKYTKQRPAILLAVVLENDTRPSQPSPDRFKAKKAPPRQGSPVVTELLPEKLEAVLIQEQGFHQIGPPDHCTDMFVLSVTVAFATKLEQLIPSTMKLSGEGSEFFFYYSLLGNDITSEPFHNLLRPDFEPERASVRIRSSKQALRVFLSQQPGLQIHLCCGNRSLGSTEVCLSALCRSSAELGSQPATAEGAFILEPPKRSRQEVPALPAELQPTVGVALTLRREETSTQSLGNKEAERSQIPSLPPTLLPSLSPSVPPGEQRPRSPSPAPAPPASHTESEADSLQEENHGLHQAGLPGLEAEVPVEDQGQVEVPVEDQGQAEALAEGGVSSVSVSGPKVSIPASAHHYCFSLDLRSLGHLSLPYPVSATLRSSRVSVGREQENAMTRLKKQQAELEAMRLRYLATEEKEAVRTDRQELDDIKNQLNRLKQQENRVGPSSSSFPGPAPARGPSPSSGALNESADEHLSRLLEERDTLLRTGVYTHEDRIITELSRQIQQVMSARGTH
ncbi:centrosomal protein of 120 kDa [Polymixia lowei]